MLDKKPRRVVLHFKHFKHVVACYDHTCSTNFITTFQIIKTNPIEFTTYLQKRKEFSTTYLRRRSSNKSGATHLFDGKIQFLRQKEMFSISCMRDLLRFCPLLLLLYLVFRDHIPISIWLPLLCNDRCGVFCKAALEKQTC